MSNVNSGILAFFRDPNASSVLSLAGQQIIAPTVLGQELSTEEIAMGGGLRIVMHVIDRSPSMSPVTKLVLEGFGDLYIQGIKEARADDVSALRLGGVSFSSDITQIWKKPGGIAFHPVEELPALTSREFDPDRGAGTALHIAIKEAYNLALQYAAQVAADTGIQPEIDIVVLTDGQNNERGVSKADIKKLIRGTKADLVRWIFLFFETSPGSCKSNDPDVNPQMIAEALGFDVENTMLFDKKPGETEKEQKSRFRRMLRVMSRVSASKGTSAVVAAATVAQASGGDEDVL